MNLVGVQFRNKGKVYHFDSGDITLRLQDKVIVETELGVSIGTVVMGTREMGNAVGDKEIKKVIRKTSENDLQKEKDLRHKEIKAMELCLSRIKAYELLMKLVDVECLYDESKMTFYFTAENRVDFRELVKDLVHQLSMKIEMRQIGVRNEAKMVGGLGSCGREICCCTFLSSFDPVSVRMAKDQNISLNPMKISGICGRLMCCLAFEHDNYVEMRNKFPKCKKLVSTKYGTGEVKRQNLLANTLVVELEGGKETEIHVDDILGIVEQNGKEKPCKGGESKK